jgi:hypothetical protein
MMYIFNPQKSLANVVIPKIPLIFHTWTFNFLSHHTQFESSKKRAKRRRCFTFYPTIFDVADGGDM